MKMWNIVEDYYVTMDSFSADCPKNWEEIANWLNARIDSLAEDLPDELTLNDVRDLDDAVANLWERYCNGELEAEGCPETSTVQWSDPWYALIRDRDDYPDWGTGTYDLEEAKRRIREWWNDGYPDAYIAVIDDTGAEPVCEDEITDID